MIDFYLVKTWKAKATSSSCPKNWKELQDRIMYQRAETNDGANHVCVEES